MKVICAPDKFKGSLSAAEAAHAMARGARRADPQGDVDLCPVADGGEGFLDALLTATTGTRYELQVTGPLAQRVIAAWGSIPLQKTAIIEMARASGLLLLQSDQRDPTRTTTFGTGQLIGAALESGHHHLIIGIGGSATNDAGCGMAQALGYRFFNQDASLIPSPITGGMLHDIARVDPAHSLKILASSRIDVACDVNNPLHGRDGAAYVYAPQKGATGEQVKQLDEGLIHLSGVLKRDLGVDLAQTTGAGAAGGLGFGLIAFAGASLRPGIQLVLEAVRFSSRVRRCDLCLTGEGRIDGQTARGKSCVGVARAAAGHGVPTVALVGSIGEGAELTLREGLRAYHLIGEGLSAGQSIARAAELVEEASFSVVKKMKSTGACS